MKILKTLNRLDTLLSVVDDRYQAEILKNADLRAKIETSRTNNAKLFSIKYPTENQRGTNDSTQTR